MGEDGETLTHVLQSKYGWRDFWFILDEANYMSAAQWAWVARFAFVGVKFLLCGDFPGQFLPISSQWETFNYEALEFSDFMHSLCNGLRLTLTTYFRGKDKEHHEFIKSLYPGKLRDLPLPAQVAAAKERYPRNSEHPHYSLVMSHVRRRRINALENERLAPADAVLLEPPSCERERMANKPQAMRVWLGLKFLGCMKQSDEKTTNGMEYEVLGTTDSTVGLRSLDPSGKEQHGAPFELSYSETAQRMRLQHALCYYTCEGRTFRDGLCVLYDTGHKFFTRRHLIVGISRCGEGRDVQIA